MKHATPGLSEHDEQTIIIAYIDSVLKAQYPEAVRLFAIPNGGLRHIREAQKLKEEGVRPGVPDLFLPVARGGYFGLFVEMKSETGRERKDQADWRKYLVEAGYVAEVAYGAQKAIALIEDYLSWEPTARSTIQSDL